MEAVAAFLVIVVIAVGVQLGGWFDILSLLF
jgi:hypothetical protein